MDQGVVEIFDFEDMKTTTWPKKIVPLTPEEQSISDDFMNHWLTVLPGKYGIVEKFNHGFPASIRPDGFFRTMEIGAGRCEHLHYENLTAAQRREYYAVEFRSNIADAVRKKFPDIQVVEADCQKRMDFPDGYFDRILAIHVLEHLPNLPAALEEAHRLLNPSKGVLVFVIPCIGGLLYRFAQSISAARIFKKRYGRPYSWFIDREHINPPKDVFIEIEKLFTISKRSYFPSFLPLLHSNVCIGAVARPKK
jgi:SAM-dependent methyltransferase